MAENHSKQIATMTAQERFEKWYKDLPIEQAVELSAGDIWQAAENDALERAAQVVEGRYIVGAETSPITAPHNNWINRIATAIRALKAVTP